MMTASQQPQQPFTPGRYVRSLSEAERVAAEYPDVKLAMRGTHPRILASGVDKAKIQTMGRLAAMIFVEAVRRGYRLDWLGAVHMANAEVTKGWKVPFDESEPVADQALVPAIYDKRVTSIHINEPRPESDRAYLSETWDRFASIAEGDASETTLPGSRSAVQLRYWGMLNGAMRDKLERGECVDLSQCPRTPQGYYVLGPKVFQDDVDYCDAQTESWIWSIGRNDRGEVHASLAGDLYQNPAYICEWLR